MASKPTSVPHWLTNAAAKRAATRLGLTIEEYQGRRQRGQKWCWCCKSWLNERSFGRDKARSDGLNNVCKACIRVRNARVEASRGAINPKRYYTGGRPANSRIEDVRRLQADGLSLVQIAKELGCSYKSVRRTIQRANDPLAYQAQRRKDRRRLAERPEFISLDEPKLHGVAAKFGAASIDDPVLADMAERLRAIVGDMEPEDVRLLDSDSLARLQERLREEGLVPRGVQMEERRRMAAPERHSGRNHAGAPLIPGRKTRQQKIAHKQANRNRGNSNRPAQKPRERWDRDAA